MMPGSMRKKAKPMAGKKKMMKKKKKK